MSWRIAISHPDSAIAHKAAPMNSDALVLIAHLRHVLSIDALKQSRGLFQMRLRIMRLNTQKEFVVRRPLEPFHVKQRVMRLRQLVQRQHTKQREERRAE